MDWTSVSKVSDLRRNNEKLSNYNYNLFTVNVKEGNMESSNIRTEVIKEINLIPEEKLAELYNFIHYFRLGVEVSISTFIPSSKDDGTLQEKIMQFAGSWNDISYEKSF